MIMNKGINPVIEVRHICKSYGTVKALQDVSLSIQQGELFGLIGPDGAGKSTLFRILTTLLNADSGEASVIGYDVHNDFRCIRSEIGYMPGRFFPLSRPDGGRKPEFLCYHLSDNRSRTLRSDTGNIRTDCSLQETPYRSIIRRNETKAGSLLCLDPLSKSPFSG